MLQSFKIAVPVSSGKIEMKTDSILNSKKKVFDNSRNKHVIIIVIKVSLYTYDILQTTQNCMDVINGDEN